MKKQVAGAAFLVGLGLSLLHARWQSTPAVAISGELRQWHMVTLTLDSPQADESPTNPNPSMDYRMTATLKRGSVASVAGGRTVSIGMPPDNATEDCRRRSAQLRCGAQVEAAYPCLRSCAS